MTQRMRAILFSVVEEYIETAQPVASRSTARRSGLDLSAATVRSEMGELVELDLLAQAHVSAGRVPTALAFRLYVDHIMRRGQSPAELSPEDARDLGGAGGELTDLMRRAADLLSRSTGQVGFFVGLPAERMVLEHVHFLRVASDRVMALLVTRMGVVQSRAFEEAELGQPELERISARLSELVQGLTLGEARARLAEAVEQQRVHRDEAWRKAVALGCAGLALAEEAELYVSDRNCLLTHPEFSDVQRLREILAALEEKERMLRLLDRVLGAEVSVALGSELDDPGVCECALVTAPLGDPPGLGGLGVIGPVRMRYDRVIPTVRYVSERVSGYLC